LNLVGSAGGKSESPLALSTESIKLAAARDTGATYRSMP
jgi:hypothetical protein